MLSYLTVFRVLLIFFIILSYLILFFIYIILSYDIADHIAGECEAFSSQLAGEDWFELVSDCRCARCSAFCTSCVGILKAFAFGSSTFCLNDCGDTLCNEVCIDVCRAWFLALSVHPCADLLHLSAFWLQIAGLIGQSIADLRAALYSAGAHQEIRFEMYGRFVQGIVACWINCLDQVRAACGVNASVLPSA